MQHLTGFIGTSLPQRIRHACAITRKLKDFPKAKKETADKRFGIDQSSYGEGKSPCRLTAFHPPTQPHVS
jgi:hypothetical protein